MGWVMCIRDRFAGGRVLSLDGPDLNVREYGATTGDRAVVLLHGYSASIEWWEQVAPALAAGNRVVAIDLVGHGGSEATGDDSDYTATGQATAVLRALDALGIRQAAFVAHSMGGHITTAIAERSPDLVERVAVIDTAGGPGLIDLPVLGQIGCWPVLGAVADRLRGIDALTEGSLRTGFADDFPVPASAHRSLEQLTHRGVCKSTAVDDMNKERPIADRLAGTGKPVLVVSGGRDVLVPTAANVEQYTRAGLPPRLIAESGHSPLLERPDELIGLVGAFVNRLRGAQVRGETRSVRAAGSVVGGPGTLW
ncbi:alpha/beta fold hydrolase, partial [Nocardia sp. NPDC058497]|uniref:alpha/beta fold hydrolase n=1 Tax=Nocardia sp. NPDC058497 TaxID=3346529 RepID=UPI003651D4CD